MVTSSSRHKIPVEWVGFYNSTGYGQAASSNVFALESSGGFDVRIHGLHGEPSQESFSREDYLKLLSMSSKLENDRGVQILHCIPEMHRRARFHPHRIAFIAFETFQPPQEWATIVNRCDAAICPSRFNKEQFERCGITRPIFVLPHVLNFDIWNDQVKPMTRSNRFTFAFIGTWRRRKGWEVLLEAWMNEFGPDESVRLVIKTDKTDQAISDVERTNRNLGKKEIAPISFERKIFSDRQMASFLKSADCYISPTMGEGFGLPALQSMAIRVPVIITNFSGCQEYAKENNCTLLEPSGFMIRESIDPVPQFANKKWPRIRVSTVQTAMRKVYQEYKIAQEKADTAYEFVHNNFGQQTFAHKFSDMMENLYRGGYSQTQAIQRHA